MEVGSEAITNQTAQMTGRGVAIRGTLRRRDYFNNRVGP